MTTNNPSVHITLTRDQLETLDEVLISWKVLWDRNCGGEFTVGRQNVSDLLTITSRAFNRTFEVQS